MPKNKQPEELAVVATSFSFMTGRPVPLPGAAGFAVPRQFSAWLADSERGVLIGFEVEVDERARIVDLAVQGSPVTPAELHDLPWGAYLDAALAKVMLRVEQIPESPGDRRITPLSDGAEIGRALSAHKSYRKNRARRAVDATRLRRIADLYLEATKLGQPTGEYIAEAENVSRGTARGLVAKARAEGILEKVGEAH